MFGESRAMQRIKKYATVNDLQCVTVYYTHSTNYFCSRQYLETVLHLSNLNALQGIILHIGTVLYSISFSNQCSYCEANKSKHN